jgi:poly(3-hydroxybutyrate) depolymerase
MPFEDVEYLQWVNCAEGIDVELYRVLGGGHTWPGMLNHLDAEQLGALANSQSLVDAADLDVAEIAGHMTRNIEATQLMMDFFDDHTAQ